MTIEKVARAIPWSLAARALAFLAGIVGNIVIVRSLGPVNWGMLSELRTVLGFAFVLIMLGLDAALVKYIPLLRVSGALRGFFRTFRGLVLLQISAWIALIVLVGAVALPAAVGTAGPG